MNIEEEEEKVKQPSWHESIVHIFGIIAFVVVITSPCWGLALLVWLDK